MGYVYQGVRISQPGSEGGKRLNMVDHLCQTYLGITRKSIFQCRQTQHMVTAMQVVQDSGQARGQALVRRIAESEAAQAGRQRGLAPRVGLIVCFFDKIQKYSLKRVFFVI